MSFIIEDARWTSLPSAGKGKDVSAYSVKKKIVVYVIPLVAAAGARILLPFPITLFFLKKNLAGTLHCRLSKRYLNKVDVT
jgi:hypothetical protein